MGKDQRSRRDGTGPYRDSFQRRSNKSGKGRRQERGEPCPKK